ncbi:hypothetical protein Tco_1036660 [Tanacetum coccineum]
MILKTEPLKRYHQKKIPPPVLIPPLALPAVRKASSIILISDLVIDVIGSEGFGHVFRSRHRTRVIRSRRRWTVIGLVFLHLVIDVIVSEVKM